MTSRHLITPTHRAIRAYYEARETHDAQHVSNEMNVRSAFERLLHDTGRLHGWTLVAELASRSGGAVIRPDGTFRDPNSLPRGYWEAKDSKDNLDSEIRKKSAKGYRLTNTIFEDTQTAVLYQNKQEVRRYQIGDPAQGPKELADLLNQFYSYTEPDIEGFEEAVEEFKQRVPELAKGLVEKIQKAHKDNKPFIAAFEQFFELCRTALNPNIRVEAVDEMLVQHLLTERLFRTIFNNPEFVKRNAIAAEVERVIEALVIKNFDRTEFLKSLDRFYVAIEAAARTLPDFSEKQHFLNTVYERFFQGYSVKLADTMGIVYTPQEIVNFMCASVAEVLEKEFGKSLASRDVYIIDPCTGTGNFVVNLLRRIPKRDLPRVYKEQLFANEVMLLPYYIAALNIEHAYYEITGEYEPFEGLCFVDTLDLTAASQGHLYVTAKNAERVERQRKAPITVVIGNPPRGISIEYSAGQVRPALYRPFTGKNLYLAPVIVDRPGLSAALFPNKSASEENRIIIVTDLAYRSPQINVLATDKVADLHLCASVDGHEVFPYFVYESDGKTRHDNITDWALEHFRKHYADKKISKWDIFHYVYGLLHHPEYRAKYAENLKRELPRIPLSPSGLEGRAAAETFWGFAKAGRELARLHVEYESLKPYKLKFIETPGLPLSYRVDSKMRLAKDKTSLKVNDSLTLSGIPAEAFEYRLGNRSALEWVIDQYQYYEDKKSGIVSDPNRAEDPEYIVRLVGQVIHVSLETNRIVSSLPPL